MHSIKIRMLRLGWQFTFVGVFAMVGGAVRNYNLPFVLAGLIVGMLILHWRWVRHSAGHWTVARQLPLEAFAGEPFEVRFSVRNHSRWLPIWLLRIDDRIGRVEAGGRRDWLGQSHDMVEATTEARCGVGMVSRLKTASVGYRCTVSKRGRYEFGPLRVTTAAPLGLLSAETTDRQPEVFYVFPRRIALQPMWQRNLHSQLGGGATRGATGGVDSGEFYGIRDWQHGDSRRQIHWRTTARRQQLAVRQYEQQRRLEVGLIIDGFQPRPERHAVWRGRQEVDDSHLEFMLSVAGSLLIALMENPHNRVSIAVAGQQLQTLVLGGGRRESLPTALRYLAELSGSASPPTVAAIQQLNSQALRLSDLIVLSTRPADTDVASGIHLAWFSTADGTIGQISRERVDTGSMASVVKSSSRSSLPSFAP